MSLLLVGLAAAGLWIPAAARADETGRRWGIGWDGRQGGPLLRWRPSPAWDLTLAAGPDDWKADTDRREYGSDYPAEFQGILTHTGGKRESGWVGLTGGRRVFSEGRFSLAGALGLAVEWVNTQDTYGEPESYRTPPDVRNSRDSSHTDTWTLTALLRPSFAISSRFSVEVDAGLEVAWDSRTVSESVWYDVSPDYSRTERSSHSTTFRTVGGFDWWKLKLVFWL